MEYIIFIIVAGICIIVGGTCFVILTDLGIFLLRALLRLPQRKRDSGWASHEDYLFGKPLNRYERRERKGRLRH